MEKPFSMTDETKSMTDLPFSMTDGHSLFLEKPLFVTDLTKSVMELPFLLTDKTNSMRETPLSVTELPFLFANQCPSGAEIVLSVMKISQSMAILMKKRFFLLSAFKDQLFGFAYL